MSTNFGAVILAGGKSSRMGRDKAWLEIGGQSLLTRQIQCARDAGAREIFISGRTGVDYSSFGCPVLVDEILEIGPLAGIARALEATREPLLLVLAVDMPDMTAECLKGIHGQCLNGCGAVPVLGEVAEPLAAFYPKPATDLIKRLIAGRGTSSPGAKHFAESCVAAGLACFVSIQPDEAALFKSWNLPTDGGAPFAL